VPQNDGAIGRFRAPGLLAARKFARQCSELPPSAEVFRSESGFYLGAISHKCVWRGVWIVCTDLWEGLRRRLTVRWGEKSMWLIPKGRRNFMSGDGVRNECVIGAGDG
jgi:hypothetical protein